MAYKRSYSSNVRQGNWIEECYLEEENLREYLGRRERGELTVQKSGLLKENILKQVSLTPSQDGRVHFGDVVMLLNVAGPASECSVISINADIDGLTKDAEPVIRAPCQVSAGGSVRACTRTAFIITSVDGSPVGSALHYEQSFTLRTTRGFAGELCLASDLQTFYKCAKKSRLQEVSLHGDPSFLSWWKVVHFDPQQRLEHEGLPVPADFKVLIIHRKTNQALAVLHDQVLWTPFGREYEVTAHTFLDSHRAEQGNNHWAFSTSEPVAEEPAPRDGPRQAAGAAEPPQPGSAP